MDITLHITESAWTLTVNGIAFDIPLADGSQVVTRLNEVAQQLNTARWEAETRALDALLARPDYYPGWTPSQGLAVLTRDGYLVDQGTIRVISQWANTCPPTYGFGWLLHLADTYTYDRFTREIKGLGDKRLQILKDALKAFKTAHPDRLYAGRLP